jgi:putative Mn2+ efflux pump MntP
VQFQSTEIALLFTSIVTALVHTLIPDHWLPFVLIGRARGWSVQATAAISGLSALIHAAVSVALGGVALALGLSASAAIGETMEFASGIMLIAFGTIYAVWAWRKGGHFHPGGRRVHGENDLGCTGVEGPSNPEHLHYHADQELIRGEGVRGGLWLALIVGLNPCVLVLPVVLASAVQGSGTFAAVVAAYSVTAVVTMVVLSTLGVMVGRQIRLPGLARHMEAVSGLVIAATGAIVLLLHRS